MPPKVVARMHLYTDTSNVDNFSAEEEAAGNNAQQEQSDGEQEAQEEEEEDEEDYGNDSQVIKFKTFNYSVSNASSVQDEEEEKLSHQ